MTPFNLQPSPAARAKASVSHRSGRRLIQEAWKAGANKLRSHGAKIHSCQAD